MMFLMTDETERFLCFLIMLYIKAAQADSAPKKPTIYPGEMDGLTPLQNASNPWADRW